MKKVDKNDCENCKCNDCTNKGQDWCINEHVYDYTPCDDCNGSCPSVYFERFAESRLSCYKYNKDLRGK